MDITWEEPPTPSLRGLNAGKYVKVFEALRERPGEWARISVVGVKDPGSLVTNIKKGNMLGCSAGEFEATSRLVEGQEERALYVRYIGSPALQQVS